MRTTITTTLLLLCVLVLAVPAAASHTFVGGASARGLELTLGEEALEIGFAESAVQSGPSDDGCGTARGDACASAAGLVSPTGTAAAHAPGSPGPREVAAAALPAEVSPLLTGEIGLARAQATTGAHRRSARGSAGGIGLALTATAALGADAQVRAALEAVAASLPPATAEGEPDPLVEALRLAVNQLLVDATAAPVVTLAGGSSSTAASDLNGVTTATAATGGATVVVGPTLRSTTADPEGLIIVEVGAATAEASSDQRTASTTLEAPPVTLSVYDPAAGAYDVREVAPGTSACAATGTPLETCVAVGNAREAVQDAGAAAALPGVSVHALAAPVPTLELSVGAAEAAVAAAPPRPAPTAPVPSRRLPATGGDLPAGPGPHGPALVGLEILVLLTAVRAVRRRA